MGCRATYPGSTLLVGTVLGLGLLTGLPAEGHDLPGLVHDFGESDLPESVKSFYRAYVAEGDERTRAVLVNAFVWPVPSQLTVCFDGGPPDLRPKIAAAMREWAALSDGNITFMFSEKETAPAVPASEFKECDGVTRYKIRIGFVKRGGHWSQIGTLSDAVFPKNSMNLDFDTDPLPDDAKVRGITLHETGHALGFHHEHQSPGTPCKNWAWDRILTMYNWPGQTKEEKENAMHFNLDRLSDEVIATGQHAYTFTNYDKDSIMHYSFPVNMFTDNDNPCSVRERYEMSAIDKQAMKDAYTRRVAGEKTRSIDALLGNARFDSFRALLNDQKKLYPEQ